ncbi:hypothetical protein WMF27_32130 [Sorangium sp. So ce281]|uniref:hypothetical protein n=1 Tax=unclassified Sorangium TaxID=2621164 RepID=UPI003F63E0E6
MTPYIYRVLNEVRIAAAEQPEDPLAVALAQHDAAAHVATKQAHLWATMGQSREGG